MKIVDIPTATFNEIVKQLRREGWRKTEEYDGFDAWIDYGRVVLEKGNARFCCEWDNWTEGRLDGPDDVVLQLADRYQLRGERQTTGVAQPAESARCPRRPRWLALPLVALALAWQACDWTVVDEGYRYFKESPSRLLLLLGMVAIGTPMLLGYEALTAKRKQQVALWLMGTLAVGATVFAVHLLWLMARLASSVRDAGGAGWGSFAALFPCVIAVYLWWAFHRMRQ